MAPLSSARRLVPLGAALAFLGTACGASIQAVYEGDVRFEHCMALDSRPDVKPTIRKACWEEWVKFYTFGQTRDRVEYAALRERQLSGASDFDEGEVAPVRPVGVGAVPDPTSALAPPPMMLAFDAGTDAGGHAEVTVAEAGPGGVCLGECETSLDVCRQQCKAASCDKTCTGKYRRCLKRCF
jgi:hypothetical protein